MSAGEETKDNPVEDPEVGHMNGDGPPQVRGAPVCYQLFSRTLA